MWREFSLQFKININWYFHFNATSSFSIEPNFLLSFFPSVIFKSLKCYIRNSWNDFDEKQI